MARLDEIEARMKATRHGWVRRDGKFVPGWDVGEAGRDNVVKYDGDDITGVALVESEPEREFIAHSREDVEYLLGIAQAAGYLLNVIDEGGAKGDAVEKLRSALR